jgi:hypothetical protein
MTRSAHADVMGVTSRALALLAAVAGVVFLAAAVAGWLTGVWPATPSTLGTAAALVLFGPLAGFLHVATAREAAQEERPQVVVASAPVLTARAASARAFHHWRESANPAIERRERERRASRYIRA